MNINTKEIETLQKQKNDLLKQVDPLIAKKKKLYSDVDITTPKSSDEKKLDKEIADLFSEINDLVHKIAKLKKSQNEGRGIMKEANVNWKEFYTMAKDTSGHNPNFEKKYGNLMDRPHIADALKKARDFNSFLRAVKQFESVNEAIAVGKMVKVVDNPYWEAALGKKGPFKRKVKMIDGDNVFFTDGSNSSMKYVKEDTQLTNEADLNWNVVQNVIINFLKANTKILDKRVQAKDTEGVKGGLKSIISGLTNAQRGLNLESVNEIKKGSVVIPYAMDKHGEFIVDKVFKNKSGETSYTGKFKKSGESRQFILHSKDKVVKESVNEASYTVKAENPYQFVNGAYAVLSAYLRDEELGPKGKRELQSILKSLDYMRKYFYFNMNESVNEVILEVAYTDKTDIKGSLLKSNEFTNLISPKVFNWVRGMGVKIFHSTGNTFTITDGKLEMVVNMAKPISVIKPIGRVRSEIKALFNENVETLPHLKKVSNEYYVDTPFIQYSNKFGNLVHAGFGDFLLKTSGGEVYFTRTSKQMPDFVGRTHTMSGDAAAIKKLIASMSSKYELNENVKKSTYNRVARILNNGKLDIY